MNEKRSPHAVHHPLSAVGRAALTAAGMIWWTTCAAAQTGGLTLRQALERALAQAPEIAGAQAEAADAAAGARTAAAGFSPQAFATTTPGYSSGLPVQVAGQVPAIFGLELHQSIYDPVRRAEALEAQARAQGLDAAAARSSATTARALVLAYGRNRADRALADNARAALEAREAMARRVAALASEGRRTQLELEEADLAVARAKQTLVDRESELDLDRLELAHLIDWKNGDVPAPAEDPLAVVPSVFPGDSLTAATAADPELAALTRQADSLDRAAYLQKRAWLPTIQGEARYLRLADYNNFDQYFVKFKNDDIAVGVSVIIPLWTGGRLTHGEAAAGARLDKVRADRRLRERDLELSVRRAEIELKRSESQAQLASRALAAAREALRVAQALAGEGRGEPDDVDLRQLELSQAQDDRIRAEQGVLAARAALLDVRGDLPGALLATDPAPKDPVLSSSR